MPLSIPTVKTGARSPQPYTTVSVLLHFVSQPRQRIARGPQLQPKIWGKEQKLPPLFLSQRIPSGFLQPDLTMLARAVVHRFIV